MSKIAKRLYETATRCQPTNTVWLHPIYSYGEQDNNVTSSKKFPEARNGTD